MKAHSSKRFDRSLRKFTGPIQKKFTKQLNILLENIGHPSLRAKKYDENRGVWQARIDRSHRFYFLIRKGVYILLDITKHKK
jgi:mRNA-degrading endonuclease RelE of RelBE toxin-antitoxin system